MKGLHDARQYYRQFSFKKEVLPAKFRPATAVAAVGL
jgi:hypothetical protein